MMDSSSNSCALGAGDINLRRAVFHDAVRLQAHISQADVMSLHGHMGVTMRGIVRNVSETFYCFLFVYEYFDLSFLYFKVLNWRYPYPLGV